VTSKASDRVFSLRPRSMKQPTAIVYLFELRITSVSDVEKLPSVHRSIHSYTTYNIALFVSLFSWRYNPLLLYFPQPGSGLWPPRFRVFLITHNDSPQSVGLLWSSDQSVAETFT
jgi:hypothetical protein